MNVIITQAEEEETEGNPSGESSISGQEGTKAKLALVPTFSIASEAATKNAQVHSLTA